MEVYIALGLGVLNLVAILATKFNDIRHMVASLDRIERRLEEHIQYHLSKGL